MHVSERVSRFLKEVEHMGRLHPESPLVDEIIISWLKLFDEWVPPEDEPQRS